MPDVADAAVARWIRRELAAHPPRARSLLVTVWGDTLAPHGGDVWLSTLIQLLAPFGVNERLVRTSVFRLARTGGSRRARRPAHPLPVDRRWRAALLARLPARVHAPFGPWTARGNSWCFPAKPCRRANAVACATSSHCPGSRRSHGVHARPQRPRDAAGVVPTLPSRAIHVEARDLPMQATPRSPRRSKMLRAGHTRRRLSRVPRPLFVSVAAAFSRIPGPSPNRRSSCARCSCTATGGCGCATRSCRRAAACRMAGPRGLRPVPRRLPGRGTACRGAPRRRARGGREPLLPALPEFLTRFEPS